MAISKTHSIIGNYRLINHTGVDLSTILGEGYKTITKDIIIQNAYIKIDSISGSKECMCISVGIYVTHEKQHLVDRKDYSFIADVGENSDNFIKQGYDFLKTLPEYAEAIDVLEEGQTL